MKSNVTFRRFAAAVTLVLAGSVLSACLVTPGDPGPADVTFTINTTTWRTTPSRRSSTAPTATRASPPTGRPTCASAATAGRRTTGRTTPRTPAATTASRTTTTSRRRLTPGAAIKPTVDQATAAGDTAIVTIPIVDYVAADRNGGCDVRNSGANYLQTRFKQNLPTKGAAFSTTPSTTDGYVYQDEFVNWLKTDRAERAHPLPARQRARPLVEHPRRGAPEPGDLRRAGPAEHRLRQGHQGGVAHRRGRRPGQLRLLRHGAPPGRPRQRWPRRQLPRPTSTR